MLVWSSSRRLCGVLDDVYVEFLTTFIEFLTTFIEFLTTWGAVISSKYNIEFTFSISYGDIYQMDF
ncbi:21770_t:CDS:2 [Cetraspora pellucida]|uniref:21770_t:CDS:1 n=1 Tax=Cetraspora pellucida TaxID=1433469 RepID=A0A9N8ZUL9_9GLOM|nr:21770_t:CDS:2 [Cetraspora pellucida]